MQHETSAIGNTANVFDVCDVCDGSEVLRPVCSEAMGVQMAEELLKQWCFSSDTERSSGEVTQNRIGMPYTIQGTSKVQHC